MKILPAVLGVAIVALIAAWFYEHAKTDALEASLARVKKDRETMTDELSKLDRRLVDLQKRQGVSPGIESPRVERPSPSPAVEKIEPVPTPGVTIAAPTGWGKNGSKPDAYVVGVDTVQTWGGMPSAYVKSLNSSVDGFGGMMQMTSAEDYVGKRVRLSGWVKTEDANEGGGHLWLRVDGEQRGVSLQFDNMNNRPVKGTSDWQEASVVLDVPQGSTALAYGFFVQGGGKMWVSGQRVEEVGQDVPTTNMITPQKPRSLPKAPVNLGFSPDLPK